MDQVCGKNYQVLYSRLRLYSAPGASYLSLQGAFPSPCKPLCGQTTGLGHGLRTKFRSCSTTRTTELWSLLLFDDTPLSTHLLVLPPTHFNFLHVDLHMASALNPPSPPVTVALCSSGKSSSQASVVLKAVTPLSADDSFASPRSLSSAFVRFSLLRLLFQSAS